MKISDNTIKKFQAGGAAPAPDPSAQGGAPAPDPSQGGDPSAQGGDPSQGGGQDPVAQLVQLAQQALQGQDCQAAMAVCDGLLSLIQSQQGGGQGGDPSQGGGDPSQGGGQPQGAPVYKRGGKLLKRV